MISGEEIEQFGDGESARDYTFVSDIVDGIVKSMEQASGFHIWNLGGSRTITLAELIQAIAEVFEVKPNIKKLPAQPGDVNRTWADIGLARRELNWEPKVSIRQGLELFREWYESHTVRDLGNK
jgi:UDP-glucuronate 4-epimerase